MASFLEKLQSLPGGASNCSSSTISLSSGQLQSNQTTKLDEQSATPIIAPLDTLEQVLSWEAGCDELCVASVPLPRQEVVGVASEKGHAMDDPSAQKMIVCHDMMGGYVKDKFTQGVRDMEDYYFYHWQHIGAFIYFSHHFITIPPPCWTNAAHRHGVLSMGTVITEWEAGAKICHSLLQSEYKATQFAQQLVGLAQYYGFDGWLINIENPIHPMLLDQLYMLLSLITTGMHTTCPGSKVIWYDSVTIEGKLKWQNQLNQMNKPYFDLCDGIFLNYNWTETGLSTSRTLARERKGEVYVGIDAFGRGCPGGGGYNSCQALKSIHQCGLSSALFAPGWVYETQDKASFFANQNRFWCLLQPWLPLTPISSLPLVSAFGRGCGNMLAIDGKVVYSGAWTNHSAQDLQPSYCTETSIQNDDQSAVVLQSAKLDLSAAYNHGASLQVRGRVRDTKSPMTKPALLRLFKTHFPLCTPLLVAYTYRPVPTDPPRGYRYFLQLHTSGSPSRIFLDPFSSAKTDSEILLRGCGLPKSCDVPKLPGCVLAPLPPPHAAALHQVYTGTSRQEQGWKTCYFVVDYDKFRDQHVQEITLGFYTSHKPGPSQLDGGFSLSIGQIQVIDSRVLSPKAEVPLVSNIWCHDFKPSADDLTVSFTLSWHSSSSPSDPIDHCNIYLSSIISDKPPSKDLAPWRSEFVFLGRSYGKCYRVTDLHLLCPPPSPSPPSPSEEDMGTSRVLFELSVQPVTASLCKPALGNCQAILLNFTQ